MLSNAASNALLKTLEEPPGHVVFVLATTNPEKVLPTIRSRTQHFELTLLSIDELTGLLGSLLEREGVEFEPDALAPIARAAGGSARDAEIAPGPGARARHRSAHRGRGRVRARRVTVRRPDGDPRRDRGRGRRRCAHRPRRTCSSRATTPAASPRTCSARCATRSCSPPARGEVPSTRPEDERERLREVGEVLGNALLVRGLETLGQAVVDMRGTDAADPAARARDRARPARPARHRRPDAGAGRSRRTARAAPRDDGVAAAGRRPARPPRRKPKAAPRGQEARARRVQAGTCAGADRRRPARGRGAPPADTPPAEPTPPSAASTGAGDGDLDLDDVIVAWTAVLESLPRSLRAVDPGGAAAVASTTTSSRSASRRPRSTT